MKQEGQIIPDNHQLPFDIKASKSISNKGHESEVFGLIVEGEKGQREIALKESRLTELADDKEMQEARNFYLALKNHPKFGKFVVDTDFIKARKNPEEQPKAYRVQKFIPGKRVDQVSDEEIYKDQEVIKELIEFIDASIEIVKETADDPVAKPDLYADTRKFLGNFLQNPRYSSNIVITDPNSHLPHRVYLVDSGQILSLKKNIKKVWGKALESVNLRLQLTQLERWRAKLQKQLKNPA